MAGCLHLGGRRRQGAAGADRFEGHSGTSAVLGEEGNKPGTLWGPEAQGPIPLPTFWPCDLEHVTLLPRSSVSSSVIWTIHPALQSGCEHWVSRAFRGLTRV